MNKDTVIAALQTLTGHDNLEITPRGDAAITAALSVVFKNKVVLIPEEGGWLSYPKIPAKLGLKAIPVKCDDAKINLADLQAKLQEYPSGAFLYQNPGGYFAEQPMKEIYQLCRNHACLVIMDVSGSIGTKLCDGKYADFLVGSFGEWKLVEARAGGFISCRDKKLFERIKKNVEVLDEKNKLETIFRKIQELPERISFLTQRRNKIIKDLTGFTIVHKTDLGFVVVVKYKDQQEKENNHLASHFELSQKESLINYCRGNGLPWTECPRYIRLNKPAISIEVKRL